MLAGQVSEQLLIVEGSMKRMIGMVCALLLIATTVIADDKPAGKRFVVT